MSFSRVPGSGESDPATGRLRLLERPSGLWFDQQDAWEGLLAGDSFFRALRDALVDQRIAEARRLLEEWKQALPAFPGGERARQLKIAESMLVCAELTALSREAEESIDSAVEAPGKIISLLATVDPSISPVAGLSAQAASLSEGGPEQSVFAGIESTRWSGALSAGWARDLFSIFSDRPLPVERVETVGTILIGSDVHERPRAIPVSLRFEQLADGNGDVHPDPATMSFLSIGDEVERAVTWVRGHLGEAPAEGHWSFDVRWRFEPRDGRKRGFREGCSVAPAFALGLARLVTAGSQSAPSFLAQHLRRIDFAGVAIAARLGEQGRLIPLGTFEEIRRAPSSWGVPRVSCLVVAREQEGLPEALHAPEDERILRATPARFVVLRASTLEEAIELLGETAVPRIDHVPLQHPHYLDRPEILEPLRSSLLAGVNRRVGVTGPADATAVPSAGVGKTVMAIAAAQDPEVRRAFPGGIFWLSSGDVPDFPSALRILTDEIGGEGRAALLVLDDIRDSNDANALDVALNVGCLLVTTRDEDVLKGLGAEMNRVEPLRPEQSLELLERWAGEEIREEDRMDVGRTADACKHVPLRLARAGATHVGRICPWADIADRAEQGEFDDGDPPHGDYR